MVTWCNRVTMSDAVALMTLNPAMLESEVDFTYINVRTGKETTRRMELSKAINLAEYRREDGRYKNFEFYIG